jgi:rRNA-processing protein FCF1/GNAT superfamily N-acetyltransferase
MPNMTSETPSNKKLQSYLIDTNILIGLEDNHSVDPAYAEFSNLAATHKIDVFVHEAARDDIKRDNDIKRRQISLSKIDKFQSLEKVKSLNQNDLASEFGRIRKPNDLVDSTLLHAVRIGAVDFLVTQDKGLHERAQNHSADLARRVLFIADATQLLVQTYEPKQVPIRHVAEVKAHTINLNDDFFDSLREGYPEFDDWWKQKCIAGRRPCWVVYDDDALAGLIVRKDEIASDTDAVTKAEKILKVCTFKVRPEKRGVKLGELLLKQILWFAQSNEYNLAYLTTYQEQTALISLIEFYGFKCAGAKENGELIYEREFSSEKLEISDNPSVFDAGCKNYPRFINNENVRAFGIPIKEGYHDMLYPDLWSPRQADLFSGTLNPEVLSRPGNTIRKVYLCRAASNLATPGSLLLFYKGVSKEEPSQAITTIGLLESVSLATSTRELMLMTGGRSVYSEVELADWEATPERPVKVINYLLVEYIDPPIELKELRSLGVVKGSNPQQSIYEIEHGILEKVLQRSNLSFSI